MYNIIVKQNYKKDEVLQKDSEKDIKLPINRDKQSK